MKRKDLLVLLVLVVVPMLFGTLIFNMKSTIGQQLGGVNGGTFSLGQKKIGVVTVEGVIYSSEKIIKQLKTIRDDDSYKAAIIKINSPGGAVAPSQEVFEEVLRFRDKCDKPVYVSMGTVAASGGYYIAAAGEKIFANSGTLTGSIGVIMQLSNYEDLLEKVGVGVTTVTAGELKDAGSPYKELSSEDRAYFDALLEDNHEQFIADVARGRSMDVEAVRPLAEGQIFTGAMALENGLIDTIATFEACKDAMALTIGVKPANAEFVNMNDLDKTTWELFLESSSPLKKISSVVTPQSGVFYLATELQ